jgi:hypothetical protein
MHGSQLRSGADGKGGGYGADPGCLVDAGAYGGSHGFAAGARVVQSLAY